MHARGRRLKPDRDGNVTLNMRGQRSVFPLKFLRKRKKRLLEKLQMAPSFECPRHEYFYDADPEVFQLILRHSSNDNELHLPSHLCGPLLERELNFWDVRVAPEQLQSCCMHWAMDSKRWKLNLNDFEVKAVEPSPDDSLWALTRQSDILSNLWDTLSDPFSSLLAAAYSIIMIVASAASAYLFSVETSHLCSDWLLPPDDANCSGEAATLAAAGDSGTAVAQFMFAVLFTGDFLLRLLLAPCKRQLLHSPFTWIDGASLLPLYCMLLLRMLHVKVGRQTPYLFALELLDVLICFRVIRFMRRLRGMRVLAYTLNNGKYDLFVLLFLMLTASFVFGTIFYFVEGREHGSVMNIFSAIYWALITMTTVGYGDITPKSGTGRFVAAMCSVFGLLLVAFTVPLLTENFQRYYAHFESLELGHKRSGVYEQLRQLRNKGLLTAQMLVDKIQRKEQPAINDV